MGSIISLDVGTSSVRALIYTPEGRELFRSSFNYAPQFYNDGRVRQQCRSWENGIHSVLLECGRFLNSSEHAGSVAALAVTSQRASVIPVDAAGVPLCDAIMWQDKTTIRECAYMETCMTQQEVYRLTGLRIDPYFSAPKIVWLAGHEPEIFSNTAKFIGVQDYVVWLLTGEYVTDFSQACRTQLMDVAGGTWSSSLLELVSIDATRLPEIVPPGTVAGSLKPDFAAASGLSSGIPVIIAGGDQQVAALGMGVIGPGSIEANTGTGSFMISPLNEPLFHPEMKTLCSAAAIPGQWVAEAGVLTTGILYDWFAAEFAPAAGGADVYREINRLVEASPPGSNGVLALPHFKGSAAPHWNPRAKGLFFNLTLASTRSDMARAVLESIVLEMGANLELLQGIVPHGITRIVVAGGLTGFGVFNQIQANVFNQTIELPPSSEASAAGALISALVTSGYQTDYAAACKAVRSSGGTLVSPEESVVPLYREAANLRGKLYKTLADSGIYEDADNFCRNLKRS